MKRLILFVFAVCLSLHLFSPVRGHANITNSEGLDDISVNSLIVPGQGVSEDLLNEFREILDKCLKKEEEVATIVLTQPQPSLANLSDSSNNVCEAPDLPDLRFFGLPDEEQNRLYVIYFQMDENQRKEQEMAFISPFFPSSSTVFPNPHSPISNQLSFWADPSAFPRGRDKQKFEVWIDGIKVENNILNSYTTTDFAGYFVSVLTAAPQISEFQFRVDLWTKTGYQEFCENYFDKPISIDKLLEIRPRMSFSSKSVLYENMLFQDDGTFHGYTMFPRR